MYFELAVALLSFRKIQQMAEVASPTDFSWQFLSLSFSLSTLQEDLTENAGLCLISPYISGVSIQQIVIDWMTE